MSSVPKLSFQYTPQGRQTGSVLVVDDDEIARSHLAVSLQGRGYGVTEAASGIQALLALQSGHFDVVIADWLMPGIDGPALCRHIRNRQNGPYVYVLLFTIRSEIADVVTALRAGADDYIVKGTSMAQIVARLESGRRMVAQRESLGSLPLNTAVPPVAMPVLPVVMPAPDAAAPAVARATQALPATAAMSAPVAMPVALPVCEPGPHDTPRPTARLALSLAGAYADCRTRHAPIALLLCAPDNLRELHERLGFETTTALMAAAHAQVAKCLLRSEWLASCGREGFLVVLPDTRLNGACLVAGKIRDALAAAAANLAVSADDIQVRLSIGIAAIEAGEQLPRFKPLDLLKAAESCFGQSRSGGGNRTNWVNLTPQP